MLSKDGPAPQKLADLSGSKGSDFVVPLHGMAAWVIGNEPDKPQPLDSQGSAGPAGQALVVPQQAWQLGSCGEPDEPQALGPPGPAVPGSSAVVTDLNPEPRVLTLTLIPTPPKSYLLVSPTSCCNGGRGSWRAEGRGTDPLSEAPNAGSEYLQTPSTIDCNGS